jgi:hypothetical protein
MIIPGKCCGTFCGTPPRADNSYSQSQPLHPLRRLGSRLHAGRALARARKLEVKKAKRATKTEFIVDATIISRMMVTSAFSDRSEFSVCTVFEGAAVALAKSLCGTADRFHTAGMSGPRDRVESSIVAPHPAKLFCVLSQRTYALIVGQRRARAQSRGTAGTWARGRASAGRRFAPPIPATRGLVAV